MFKFIIGVFWCYLAYKFFGYAVEITHDETVGSFVIFNYWVATAVATCFSFFNFYKFFENRDNEGA